MRRLMSGMTFCLLFICLAHRSYAATVPDITPNPLIFPDTVVGQTAANLTVTVTNTSPSTTLKITTTSLGDQVNFHVIMDTCAGVTLPASGSCTITFDFTPTSAGLTSTTMAIANNGPNAVDYAVIKGRGIAPAVTLSRTFIDLGDHPVGLQSEPQMATLINSGDSTLNITSIGTSGVFNVTDDCGATVAPSATCTISVTFTPTSAMIFTSSVVIVDDASDSPQSIALQGTGVSPGQAGISVDPLAIDFGNVQGGTTSSPVPIVITNTGTVALDITAIDTTANFSQINTCPASLPNHDDQCTILATFTPPGDGSFNGVLTISDNAPHAQEIVTLSGVGTPVGPNTPLSSLSVTSLNFGDQAVNTQSNPQTVTVTNAGTGNLVFGTVSIDGEGAHAFSKHDHCQDATIVPGANCTILVTFTPDNVSAHTAVMSITSNSEGSPQAVELDGNGILQNGGGGGCSLVLPR